MEYHGRALWIRVYPQGRLSSNPQTNAGIPSDLLRRSDLVGFFEMTIEEEHRALLRAGLLPEGVEMEAMLWGVISGGRLEGREGILFLAGSWWGFYGRDFVYLTKYAGFVGALSRLSRCDGPLATGDTMESYLLEGSIEGEGSSEHRYFFTPSAETYRRRPEEIAAFFGALRQRVNNQIHPDALGLFRQGMAHWDAGHLLDAEELLAAAGRIDPRSATPAFVLGQLLLEQGGRSREALQQLQIAQQRLFEDPPALFLALAQAHQQAGDLRAAEREARASLQYQESAEAHFLLAEIAAEQSRARERAQHLKQAVALDPNGPYAPWLAYDATQEKNWGHARQHLSRLSKEQQSHPAALLSQAYLAHHEGRIEDAIALARKAAAQDPKLAAASLALERWDIPIEIMPERAMAPSDPREHATETTHLAAEMLMWLHEQEQRLSREEIPQMLQELSAQIEIFSEQWGAYLVMCLLRGESLDQAMEALQSRLREGMTEQARGFLQRTRGWLYEQWAAFVSREQELPLRSVVDIPPSTDDPIAMTGTFTQQQLLLRLFEHAEIRLEALFSQLLQYTLGLLDGGLVTLFLLDLQHFEEQPDAGRLASLLRERLRPIAQRLAIYLKAWMHQHIDLLETAMGRLLEIPIPPHEQTPRLSQPLRPLDAPILAETSALEIPLHRGETTALPLIPVSSATSATSATPSTPPVYRAERSEALLEAPPLQAPPSPPPTSAPPSRSASKSSISVSSAPGGGLFFLPKLPGEDQRAEAIPSTHRPSSSPRSAPLSSTANAVPSKHNPLSGAAKAYRVSALSPSGSNPLFSATASSPSSHATPSLTERVLTTAIQPDSSDASSPLALLSEPNAVSLATSAVSPTPSLRHDETTALDTSTLRPQIAGEETPPTPFPAVAADEIPPDPQDDPIGWAYAMYRRAFQSLGHAEPPTPKERFVRILETKVHAWKQRTGQDPDIYVEIEHGRPQIKLRERETPRSRT